MDAIYTSSRRRDSTSNKRSFGVSSPPWGSRPPAAAPLPPCPCHPCRPQAYSQPAYPSSQPCHVRTAPSRSLEDPNPRPPWL
eukprot:scaffold81141_cov38-Prasinocladus_malaysianus.AAC.1